jgi:hypothetical protein
VGQGFRLPDLLEICMTWRSESVLTPAMATVLMVTILNKTGYRCEEEFEVLCYLTRTWSIELVHKR